MLLQIFLEPDTIEEVCLYLIESSSRKIILCSFRFIWTLRIRARWNYVNIGSRGHLSALPLANQRHHTSCFTHNHFSILKYVWPRLEMNL